MRFTVRKALILPFILAALLIFPLPVLADDDDEQAKKRAKRSAASSQASEKQAAELTAPVVMVTASRVLTDVFELPMTVNVLTEEDLRHNPKMDLGEILNDIPGVSVEPSGGPGTGRISIRGEHAGRTLLLIDGVRMTNQAQSATVTSFVMADPSNIERIEVIKGPASVLYGSEAIGGVVNIITKKGGTGKPIGFRTSVKVDTSNLSVNPTASVFGDYNGINYRFSTSTTTSGNIKKADGTRTSDTEFNMRQYTGQLGYKWDSGNFSIQANRYQSDLKAVMDNADRFMWPINDRDTLAGTLVFDDVSEYLTKLTFTATAQNAERMWFSPGGDVYSDQDLYELSVQSDWKLGNHNIIAGLEYSFDDVTSSNRRIIGLSPIRTVEGEQTKFSAFVQDEWKFHEDWIATMGLRSTFLEAKRKKGSLFTPAQDPANVKDKRSNGTVGSLGLTYTGFDDWALRAAWNQGRRDPSLSHLMIGSAGMGLQVYLPNPDLEPETSNNFEVGARYRDGGWDIDMAVYYNQAKNFFDTKDFGGGVQMFVNADKAKTFGSELSVAYTFDGWNLTPYSNFTWMHRKTTEDGITISGSSYGTPRFRGKTGLKWHSDPSRSWTFFADGYVDWASKGYKLSGSPRPAWQDASLNFGFEGGESIKYNVTFGVRNMFNQDFANSKGGSSPVGRHYVVGVGFEY